MKLKKKKLSLKKLFIFFTLFLSFTLIGSTYATWNTDLSIRANVNTGAMKISMPPINDDYSANLTESDGKIIGEINATFSILEQGKKAEVKFTQGLPIKEFLEGKMIKIDFPLTSSDTNTINAFKEAISNDKAIESTLDMKVSKTLINYNNVLYEPDGQLIDFAIPLKFNMSHKVILKDKETKGEVCLKLSQESINNLQKMPDKVVISKETYDKFKKIESQEEQLIPLGYDGVMVTYICEIPFFIDQEQN